MKDELSGKVKELDDVSRLYETLPADADLDKSQAQRLASLRDDLVGFRGQLTKTLESLSSEFDKCERKRKESEEFESNLASIRNQVNEMINGMDSPSDTERETYAHLPEQQDHLQQVSSSFHWDFITQVDFF